MQSVKFKIKKINVLFILTFAFCILHFAFSSDAAFVDIGEGARPAGMGKAFVAIADDANSLYYNVAGIAKLNKFALTGTYTKLYVGFPGLVDGFAGVIYPVSALGVFGVSWQYFGLQDSPATYYENNIGLAFAYPIGNTLKEIKFFPKHQDLFFGVKVKLLNKKYGTNQDTEINPDFTGKNTNLLGVTFDLGLLYIPIVDRLMVGFSFENITEPDIKLYSNDKVPLLLRGGVTLKMADALLTTEIDYRNKHVKNRLGLEYWFKQVGVGIRGGLGIGTGDFMEYTMGASYGFPMPFANFQFDYAFILPVGFAEGIAGTHRVSVTLTEL